MEFEFDRTVKIDLKCVLAYFTHWVLLPGWGSEDSVPDHAVADFTKVTRRNGFTLIVLLLPALRSAHAELDKLGIWLSQVNLGLQPAAMSRHETGSTSTACCTSR